MNRIMYIYIFLFVSDPYTTYSQLRVRECFYSLPSPLGNSVTSDDTMGDMLLAIILLNYYRNLNYCSRLLKFHRPKLSSKDAFLHAWRVCTDIWVFFLFFFICQKIRSQASSFWKCSSNRRGNFGSLDNNKGIQPMCNDDRLVPIP